MNKFLPTLRELALAYQAFEHYSTPDLNAMGLTTTQFDVIATLGNQPPMSCKALGERTLVTKGTLTGVLERLETKGILERKTNPEDARSQMISLTQTGQTLFETVFPQHLEHLEKAFGKLSTEQLDEISKSLQTLKNIFKN
ncbi:MAG: MarR family winged helix-turn-helix transcriptional regulator [Polynucleobacter sp.]